MRDTYRYFVHAYEDAKLTRALNHPHGGTTVSMDGARALDQAELLAKGFPDGWVYVDVQYVGKQW